MLPFWVSLRCECFIFCFFLVYPIRFGGLTCLLGLLETQEALSTDTRCLAVGAIGTLAQNNIQAQEDIFKKGIVDKLSAVSLTNESFIIVAKVCPSLKISLKISTVSPINGSAVTIGWLSANNCSTTLCMVW